MKIPIQIGNKAIYPHSVIMIKSRDRVIESVYLGNEIEILAQHIPCYSQEDRQAIEQSLAEGWEFFCAVMPDGHPEFWVKDAKYLEAAEKIVAYVAEMAPKMPGDNVH
jgi:hypothetical protein